MKRLLSAVVFGCALAGAASLARAEPYKIDPGHTQILFAVDHFGFSTVHGEFKSFTVNSFSFDPAKPGDTAIDLTIDPNTIDTTFAPRDVHLKTKDFFNVEAFPAITFKSTGVQVSGETAKLTGDLTMLGVTKPFTLDVKLNKHGPHAFMPGTDVAGFSATGTLKRSEFGMTYGVPGVSDEVAITISAEVNNAPPPPAQ